MLVLFYLGNTTIQWLNSSEGQPELRIELDYLKMARYGVNVADANDIIEIAVGGKTATTKYEGERKFDIRVRYEEPYRNSVGAIGSRNLTVGLAYKFKKRSQ